MKTTESKAAAAARIGAGLGRRKRAELLELLRPCFARVEPWLQAGKYAAALMSDLPRRNGWTLAERAGDRTPDRMQRLLSRAVWDAAAVIKVVRRFAVAGLDQAARDGGRRGLAVGAIDETSQVKQGTRTAGVKRHYLGCAGKVANGITTVHLAYAREGIGHALIAARQWIPREQLEDPAKRRVMRLPPDLAFRTKGQLAIDLIGEVLADGIGLDFACGDEVYGRCTLLREYLDARGLAYVLRVPSNFYLTVTRGVRLTCKQAASHAGGRPARLGGPLGRSRRQGPALVRLGLAGHRLPAALPAHPPPPDHWRAGLSLLLRTQPASRCRCPGWSAPPAAAGRLKKISDPGRAASGLTSPRSGCSPRSPGTPRWSWPPWPSAPSPPPSSAAAPTPGHPPRSGQISPRPPTRE